MQRPIHVLAVLCFSACCAFAGAEESRKQEPAEGQKPTVKQDAQDLVKVDEKADEERANRSMQSRISFEFAQTPIEDALEFLRTKANLNVVLDPDVSEGDPRLVTMKLSDVRVGSALQLLCRQAKLKFDLENEAVYVRVDDDAFPPPPPEPPKPDPAPEKPAGKLRLRLGNGNELEADAEIFAQKPDLLEDVVQRFNGAPDHQIISIPMAHDNPNREGLIGLLTNLANATDITVDYNPDLQVLVMRGKNTRLLSDMADVAFVTLKQKKPQQEKLDKPERVEKMEKGVEIDPKKGDPDLKKTGKLKGDPLF